MIETTLQERINIILKEQNLKKVEFATQTGVSPNYIYLLSSGHKKNISMTLALLINQLYGYDEHWLLYGNSKNKKANLKKQAIAMISKMNEEELSEVYEFLTSKYNKRKDNVL